MKRLSIVPLLVAAAMLAACTPAPSPTPTTPTPSAGATSSVTPTTAPSVPETASTASGSAPIRVYFDLGEKMQPAARSTEIGDVAVLKAALTALLAGPTAAEKNAGLHTLIPAGTKLNGVSIAGGTATVDLSSKFASGGGTLSMTNRLAQVVFTATQFRTVSGVDFRLDGKPVKVFGGEGIILDHPQTRADYEGATPAILVDDPAWLATIHNGSVARGSANVFEASFQLQLRDSTGKLLVTSTIQATSGTGTRGTWSKKLTWKSAKSGIGKLKVFAYSAKDGKPIDVVTIPVRID